MTFKDASLSAFTIFAYFSFKTQFNSLQSISIRGKKIDKILLPFTV